jgi:starch synthase (maltosyl-transferring)
MLCVSRRNLKGDDAVLMVVNLDPFNVREATTWLDLSALGLSGVKRFEVRDELSDVTYTWTNEGNYVRLDPKKTPAHIFHVRHSAR